MIRFDGQWPKLRDHLKRERQLGSRALINRLRFINERGPATLYYDDNPDAFGLSYDNKDTGLTRIVGILMRHQDGSWGSHT